METTELAEWQKSALARADEVFGCGPGFTRMSKEQGDGVCACIYDSIDGAADFEDALGNISRAIEELRSAYDAIAGDEKEEESK